MSLSFRFGTVGSPIGTPKKPGGSVGSILFSKTIGLDAMELGWVQAVRVSPETCAVINQAASQSDVAVSVHAPYFINLNADDEEWPKSRKRLMDAALYGNLAGATDIIFHPGSYFERPAAELRGPSEGLNSNVVRIPSSPSRVRGPFGIAARRQSSACNPIVWE